MDSHTLPMQPEIRAFLEGLLVDAHISPEGTKLKEMMIDDLFQRLQTRIMQVLAGNLEAEDLEVYTSLALDSQEQAIDFLAKKNPNFPVLIRQAMDEFRQTFLQ